MPKEVTFIRLEPALKRLAEQAAAADQRSLSSWLGKLVAEWAQTTKPAKPKEKRR